MAIIRSMQYSFSTIIADTPALIIEKKSVTFKNLGTADAYINGIKAIPAGESLSLGGNQDKDIDDVFAITFPGLGTKELLVILETEIKNFV